MTDRENREQQQAELLWRYIEELRQADNPEEVQFVAVTSGECAEVVGLMETASEAYALARADAAPHCRRESIRQRLQAAIAGASPPAAPVASGAMDPLWLRVRELWRGWRTSPLTGRSTGWAVAALVTLLWFVAARPQPGPTPPLVATMSHADAVEAMPALLEGKLDVAQTAAMWQHINHCPECFRLYEEKWRLRHQSGYPGRQSGIRPPSARQAGYRHLFDAGRAAPDLFHVSRVPTSSDPF
jgi:hypothetical protein